MKEHDGADIGNMHFKGKNDDEDGEVAGDDEVDVHWGGTTHVSVGLPTLSFDFLPASHLSAMLYTLYVFVFVFEVFVSSHYFATQCTHSFCICIWISRICLFK